MSIVAVIGAGASGCLAAATASANGHSVLLFDKKPKIARKVLITGKGRCNVLNNCDIETFLSNIPRNPKFLYSAIYALSPEATLAMFTELGLKLKTERGNRVFPESDLAMDVVRALDKLLKNNNVELISETVLDVLSESGAIRQVVTGKKTYDVDAVIIATGGLSYPLTGSSGDGYNFATKLGHTIINPKASLIPLIADTALCKSMQGLALKNIGIKLIENNKEIFNDFGEMLFTHFGMSGPIILSSSAHIKDNKKYHILIDLKPALSAEKLDKRLLADFAENINKDLINSLDGLLPKKMIAPFIKKSGIDMHKKVNLITKEERASIITTLKNFRVDIDGTMPVDEAIITRGGVNTKEISPKDMQSKIVSGLYFAGEVIDVDAYTGGFNLQIAWSTGFLAGDSI